MQKKKARKQQSSYKQVANRTKNANEAYLQGMQLKKRFEQSDKKDKEDILYAIQKFNNAITQLTTSTGHQKQNATHAMFAAARGQCQMILKQYQKAFFDFVLAIKFDENESNYYQSRGNCQLQLGHINEALSDFQMAIKKKPTQGFNYLNRALVHARLQNFKAAIEDYTSAIHILKDSAGLFKAYFHRGNCRRYQKDFDTSIDDLIKACQIIKIDSSAQNSLGLSYFENAQYQQSLESFSKAIELNDKNATYFNNKALALYHSAQYQLSLDECNKALKLDPQDSRIYYNRGNCLLALGRVQQAHININKSIQLDPNNPKFYHSKGLAFQDEDYKQAIIYFQKALEVDPQNIPSLYHLGLMQHKNCMLGEALDSLTTVIQTIGEERLVLESRGLVFQDNKSHGKAVQDFTRAIQLEPTYAEVYYYRGLSKIQLVRLQDKGTYNNAIDDFKKASQLGSKNSGIYSGIGQAYRLMGDFQKALYYLNQAISRQSTNIQFLIQRSNVFVDINEYSSAINDLTIALNKKSNDPQILYKRGLAYYKNNQYKKCIKDLFEAFKNKPYQTYEADMHYHLGISFANLQIYQKAIDPLNLAIKLSPNEPCYIHQRAKCFLLTNEYELAVNDFFNVISMQPRNANAYFGRAFAYKALRKYNDAAEDFQKAKELNPFNPMLIINPTKIYSIPYIKLCKPGEQIKQRQDNLKIKNL